jgi:predicted Zn-dependent peptidase
VDEELARLGAEAPTAEEMERAQALLEREWLDRLGTVTGRANELCRYAMLFGNPRLAFTAVDRISGVTAEPVREVAATRLRPDNRAVLAYEPITPGGRATGAAGGPAGTAGEDGQREGAGQ